MKTCNPYFIKIIESIVLNYKSWILYLVCSTIICDGSFLLGLVSFLYTYLACYAGHYLMHIDFFYCNMYSLSHCHHHVNNETTGYLMNCITEFLTLANNIVLKYVLNEFEIVNLFFIQPPMIFFLYFIYTTVHNINYGIFHVNEYHEIHHALPITNIGPDFYDLLFGSKNEKTQKSENIDHYIPNTLFAFILVMLGKELYKENSSVMNILFWISWVLLSSVVFAFSLYILFMNIREKLTPIQTHIQ